MTTSVMAKHGGIRIVCVDADKAFAQATQNALTLIKNHDPAGYARLQKKVLIIRNTKATLFACYERTFRECQINFSLAYFDWARGDGPEFAEHYDWYLAQYAATLIHEATHGRLDSLGFSYTKETRLQCERICEAEARRFAARLPQTRYDFAHELVKPFDASRWDYDWNTPHWQQTKDTWRRLFAKTD